jgi:hypothetical protein
LVSTPLLLIWWKMVPWRRLCWGSTLEKPGNRALPGLRI